MHSAKKLTEKQIEHREQVEDFKASNRPFIISVHLTNIANTYGLDALIETIELMGLRAETENKKPRRKTKGA